MPLADEATAWCLHHSTPRTPPPPGHRSDPFCTVRRRPVSAICALFGILVCFSNQVAFQSKTCQTRTYHLRKLQSSLVYDCAAASTHRCLDATNQEMEDEGDLDLCASCIVFRIKMMVRRQSDV